MSIKCCNTMYFTYCIEFLGIKVLLVGYGKSVFRIKINLRKKLLNYKKNLVRRKPFTKFTFKINTNQLLTYMHFKLLIVPKKLSAL